MTEMITSETSIEELITRIPSAVTFLMDRGIRCMACGEPIWGTLGEAAREKGFPENRIAEFVGELNALEQPTRGYDHVTGAEEA